MEAQAAGTWRTTDEHGEHCGARATPTILMPEPDVVLMVARAEPGDDLLHFTARPPKLKILMAADNAEPGYSARPCTYTPSVHATNAGADCLKAASKMEPGISEGHFGTSIVPHRRPQAPSSARR